MVMAPAPTHDSAVLPCFHGCLAFLHRHFPPQSPPSLPLDLSLHSCCPFQEFHVPVQHMYGCSKDCLILIPFRLPQISCFTLSLKCFSSDSDNCPTGDRTPVSAPQPVNGKSSPTNTPVFPSSSFILPSFVWFYIFFSTGQVLLSSLIWCSACISVSEGVFLMYPWKEMYSMSTYSS